MLFLVIAPQRRLADHFLIEFSIPISTQEETRFTVNIYIYVCKTQVNWDYFPLISKKDVMLKKFAYVSNLVW